MIIRHAHAALLASLTLAACGISARQQDCYDLCMNGFAVSPRTETADELHECAAEYDARFDEMASEHRAQAEECLACLTEHTSSMCFECNVVEHVCQEIAACQDECPPETREAYCEDQWQ